MDNFYVYMYLRVKNSKHGTAHTPYYIGKGKGMRAYSQNRRIRPPKDRSRIVFAVRGVSEEIAHTEEKRLIAIYGRIDNGTGCLRNLTDGGEGQCGAVISLERRKALSERMKGKQYGLGWKASPEQRARLSAALTGGKRPPRTPEHLAKISRLGSKQSLETIEKCIGNRRGVPRPPLSEEWKNNISKGRKGIQRSPATMEERRKISEAQKGRKMSEETRRRISETKKGVSFTNSGSFQKGSTPWNKKAAVA